MESCVYKNQIREINDSELNLVSGGSSLGVGGLFGVKSVAAALRVAGGVGLLYQSASIGWDIGSWGYNTYTNYRYNSR